MTTSSSAVGVAATFLGVPGADVHARTIYTRGDAVALRDLLFTRLEAAAQGRPGAVEPVVVIVGAGPTGVELAGALAELRKKALPVMYPDLDLERVRIVLVEMTDHVLGQFSPKLRRSRQMSSGSAGSTCGSARR